MSKLSIPILKVWGIPIRLHASIVLIIPFLLMDFESARLIIYCLVGMLVSITLHELGHCVVAMRKGCGVREILLVFPIGGIARMERMPARPRDEALMAAAGPAVSLILFVVLFFGGAFLPLPRLALDLQGRHLINIVQLLGLANLVLFGFNLVPAFPMDGGRILRAWLTSHLGHARATLVASLMGKAGATVLFLIGIAAYWRWKIWTVPVVAIFLYILAGQEYRATERRKGQTVFGFGVSGDHDEEEWQNRVEIGPPPYRNTEEPSVKAPIVREHRQDIFRHRD